MVYIGVDLGGTNIAAGIVDENGKILKQGSVPTNASRPTEEIAEDMAKLPLQLLGELGMSVDDVAAVGIGAPGSIDHKNGVIMYSNNIPIRKYPMAEEIRKYIDKPVFIENDANCAALGEYVVNGENAEGFVMVTLGTGVGGGIVLDGKLLCGFNGVGGEVGHMTLVNDGIKCSCGHNGCWESYASVTALIRQTKEAMEQNPESLMHQIADKEGKVSGRTAFEAAKAGDEAGKEVVKNYVQYVAEGIVSLENIFQPNIISVGGGISKEGEYLMKPVREYVQENAYNKYMPHTKIVTAKLFNDAGIIGAAMNAKNRL